MPVFPAIFSFICLSCEKYPCVQKKSAVRMRALILNVFFFPKRIHNQTPAFRKGIFSHKRRYKCVEVLQSIRNLWFGFHKTDFYWWCPSLSQAWHHEVNIGLLNKALDPQLLFLLSQLYAVLPKGIFSTNKMYMDRQYKWTTTIFEISLLRHPSPIMNPKVGNHGIIFMKENNCFCAHAF